MQFHFSPGAHRRDCGPRGRGRRSEWDVERFFHWVERLNEGRPSGRARRMFDGNELRLLLLILIEDAPRHGYDLIREIEERSGGAYAPSPGVVYPTLTMLAEMELIAEQASDGVKKVFAITEAGRAHLEERAEEDTALLARLAELNVRSERGHGGPVRRAMGNLRAVLGQRLGAGEADAETLHKIAAIIDDAAQRIERL